MSKLEQNTTGLQNILEAANSIDTEVNTQSNLLAQIVAALEGKADGGDLTPIIDALTEKGVEVPSGTNVTGLAELISAIEAGGGGGDLVTGSFTLASDDSCYKFYDVICDGPASLGILVSENYANDVTAQYNYVTCCQLYTAVEAGFYMGSTGTKGTYTSYPQKSIFYKSGNRLCVGVPSGVVKFRAGITYHYAYIL